jgi:hypothetical protein
VIVYQHPGLRGLELWQGLAGRATLYQLRDEKTLYFKALSGFLEDLHQGVALAWAIAVTFPMVAR